VGAGSVATREKTIWRAFANCLMLFYTIRLTPLLFASLIADGGGK